MDTVRPYLIFMHEKLSWNLVGSCSMVCMHRGSLEAGAQILVARQYIPSLWHAVDQSIDFLQWYIIPRLLHMFPKLLLVGSYDRASEYCVFDLQPHLLNRIKVWRVWWVENGVMPSGSLTSLEA